MKLFIRTFLAAAFVLLVVSCKKQYPSGTIRPAQERKIRFQLYTNQDFSDNASVIIFSVFIRDANKTLFDSTLASMRIQDIPDSARKLIIEKTVNDNSDLAAGFRYEIHDVGTSSFIDTSKAGNAFKIIDYPFQ